MNWILIYLIVVVVLAITVVLFYDFQVTKRHGQNASTAFSNGILIGALTTIMLVPGAMSLALEKVPKAIDAYRGKTDIEIQYTIRNNDTISCDTTVVFK